MGVYTKTGQGLQQLFWNASNVARSLPQSVPRLVNKFQSALASLPMQNKSTVLAASLALLNPTDPNWVMASSMLAGTTYAAQTKIGRAVGMWGESKIQRAFELGVVYTALNGVGEAFYLASGIHNDSVLQMAAAIIAFSAIPASMGVPSKKPLSPLFNWGRREAAVNLVGLAGVMYMLVGLGVEPYMFDITSYKADHVNIPEFITGLLIVSSAVLKRRGIPKLAASVYTVSGLALLGAAAQECITPSGGFDFDRLDLFKTAAAFAFMSAGYAMAKIKTKVVKKPAKQDELEERGIEIPYEEPQEEYQPEI